MVSTSGNSGMNYYNKKKKLSNFSLNEKNNLVNNVFSSVAANYDLMNDIMSLGMHRLWKESLLDFLKLDKNDLVLDLAGGSGDMSYLINKKFPGSKNIFISDPNLEMLNIAKKKLFNTKVNFFCNYAENLPFKNNFFDCVIVSFGTRNFLELDTSIKEIYRVLKKGKKFFNLDFSKINKKSLRFFFNLYCDIIPKLGEFVAKDESAYRYLIDSIKIFPDQIELKKIMIRSGFNEIECYDFFDGLASLHIGIKK